MSGADRHFVLELRCIFGMSSNWTFLQSYFIALQLASHGSFQCDTCRSLSLLSNNLRYPSQAESGASSWTTCFSSPICLQTFANVTRMWCSYTPRMGNGSCSVDGSAKDRPMKNYSMLTVAILFAPGGSLVLRRGSTGALLRTQRGHHERKGRWVIWCSSIS